MRKFFWHRTCSLAIFFVLLILFSGSVDAAVYLYRDSGNGGLVAFEIHSNQGKERKSSILKVFSHGTFMPSAIEEKLFFFDFVPQKSTGEMELWHRYEFGSNVLRSQNERWSFHSVGHYQQVVCENNSKRCLKRYLLDPQLKVYPAPRIISKMNDRSFYLVSGSEILPMTKKKSGVRRISLSSLGREQADIEYNKKGIATDISFASGKKLILQSAHPKLSDLHYREVILKPEHFSRYFDPHGKQMVLGKPLVVQATDNDVTYQRDVTSRYDVTKIFADLVRKKPGEWIDSSPRSLSYIDFDVKGSQVVAIMKEGCDIKYFNDASLIEKKKKEFVEDKKKKMGSNFHKLIFNDNIKWELDWVNGWKPEYGKLQAHLNYVLVEKKRQSKSFNILPLLEKKFIIKYGKDIYNLGKSFDISRDRNYVYYERTKRNLFKDDSSLGSIACDIDALGLNLMQSKRTQAGNDPYENVEFSLDSFNQTLTSKYTATKNYIGSLIIEIALAGEFRQRYGFFPPDVSIENEHIGVRLTGHGSSYWDYQPLFMEMLEKVDFSQTKNLNCFGDNKLFSEGGRLYIKKKCRVYQSVHKITMIKAIKRYHHCVAVIDDDFKWSYDDGRIRCRFWGGKIGR